MIERDIPLSEVMRRLHEMNEREDEHRRRDVRDSVAGVVIGLFLSAVFVWGYLVVKTVEERKEARQAQVWRTLK
jgi:hypothetical protein